MTVAELRKIFKQIDYYRGGSREEADGWKLNDTGGRRLDESNSSVLVKVGKNSGFLTDVAIPEGASKKGVGEKLVLVSKMRDGVGGVDKSRVLKLKSIFKWLAGEESKQYSKAEIILRTDFDGGIAEQPMKDITFRVKTDKSGNTRHQFTKGSQVFFCDTDALKEIETRRYQKALKKSDEVWSGHGWDNVKQSSRNRITGTFRDKWGEDLPEESENIEEAEIDDEYDSKSSETWNTLRALCYGIIIGQHSDKFGPFNEKEAIAKWLRAVDDDLSVPMPLRVKEFKRAYKEVSKDAKDMFRNWNINLED